MRLLRIGLMLSLAVSSYPIEKEILTHEMMWTMKRVGAPVPSPDGEWVIVPVTEPDYDPEKEVSDLWIVPSDGNRGPRRLTFSKGGESGVDWSPDSRKIAFTAKREGDEKSQVYVLDIAGGGEAVRITNLTMGASAPVWSPDGQRILFTSSVYPEAYEEEAIKKAVEERKERKYETHAYDGFPIRYWDHWLDDTKEHLFLQEAEPDAKAKNILAKTKLAKGPGFLLRGAVWAPEGKSVVFAATVNRQEAAYAPVISHLYRLAVDGGEPRDITPGKDSYRNPKFRPDGKALYADYEPTNDFVYNHDRLAMTDWPKADRWKVLTQSWDRSVGGYAFSPDSREVYIQANDNGAARVFRMPAGGGEVELAVEMEEGTYSGLAVPAKAPETIVLANWQSHRSPNEAVRVELASKKHRNLTGFNEEAAARIDAQPARHFWFTSKKGRKIHNLLILPPRFDETKKYPLVLFIHGGPHSMSADDFHPRWNYLLLASQGYVLLMTNYTGSVGFGEEFSRAIQGDPLKTPGEEINEAVDEAIRRFPFIDSSRIAAGGASYGGHLSNWLQATTDRFVCLYSHAGLISLEGQWATSDVIYHRERNNGGPYWEGNPIWKDQSPFTYGDKFQTPVLLTIGVNDYRVPINQTLAYWSVLKRRRIPSRLVVFSRANHWIMNGEDARYFYEELNGWLAKYLGSR